MLSPSLFLYLVLFSAYLLLGQVLISNSAPSTKLPTPRSYCYIYQQKS